jgi:hypothetical protein
MYVLYPCMDGDYFFALIVYENNLIHPWRSGQVVSSTLTGREIESRQWEGG